MRITLLVACLWLATNTLNAKIVFRSKRDGRHEIYTVNSDGTNPTRVTHDPTSALSPAWSPNGRQIAFHSRRGSQVVLDSNIWVIDADGKNLRQLTHHPEWDNYPDWSPDGLQIAFDSDRLSKEGEPPRTEIYVMDADGGNVTQVTDLDFASKPRWSPDGEWILFEGDIDQGRGIYAIRPDGTDLWMVSEPVPGAALYLGGWSPDGKRILYKGSIGDVRNSFVIIATLQPIGRVRVKR
jgi:TolB protein